MFLTFHQTPGKLLTDFRITIEKSLESGDWISARRMVTARAKASGKPVSFPGALHCRIGGGQPVEGSNHFDFLSLFYQLGVLPTETLDRCLTGNNVA